MPQALAPGGNPAQSSRWRDHALPTEDGVLFWRDKGAGPPVVFLHGGPGDEHRSLVPMADPLTKHFRCVVYDQRGSGGSTLVRFDEPALHPDRFVADLEALRVALGTATLALVGHSWGAMLALLYGAAHPKRVERLALIGLGPLRPEMDAVAKANLMKPLTLDERAEHAQLTAAKRRAVEAGDEADLTSIYRRRMALGFRGMFYKHELIGQAVEDWLTYEPYRNPRVNAFVLRQLDREALWERLPELAAPTLVFYGYQDFEPITQAYELKARMPNVEVVLANECGHVPWLEQPDAVTQALSRFLGAPVG